MNETFIETEMSGFYIGSNGSVINKTGFRLKRNNIKGQMYVGIEYNYTRIMRSLAKLVYQYHINNGKPIDFKYTMKFRDNNPLNCSKNNVYLGFKKSWTNYNPHDMSVSIYK